MSFLEAHSAVVYPLFALLVVAMVITGVLQAWRGRDLAGLSRLELKREIILELRRRLQSRDNPIAEEVAQHLGLPVEEVRALIDEMRRDGVLPPEVE